MKDGQLDLAELRGAFVSQKDLLDYELDHVTDLNLLVGLPQQGAGESKVALRNSGAADVTVTVEATTASWRKPKGRQHDSSDKFW